MVGDEEGRDGIAVHVGQVLLRRSVVEEASHHIPSIVEEERDVHIGSGRLDPLHIATVGGGEIHSNLSELQLRELGRQLRRSRREQRVVECDQNNIDRLPR
eukprot:scaffold268350_cov36-Tisochrysis_lutea.AAC.2